MSLSAILTEAYHFYRNHISQLAMLTIPLLLLQIGIQMWLGLELKAADIENPQFGSVHMVAMMALLILFSLLIAALTLFLEIRSQGHKVGCLLVLKASLPFVPPLLLAGVFSGMAIIAPVMIAAAFGPLWVIGLVPSLYLFARFSFVNFMVVSERLTPFKAIKESFSFTSDMPLLLRTGAVLTLYLPISIISQQLSMATASAGLAVELVIATVFGFLGLFVNIALFRLYMVARRKDTGDTDTSAE